MKPLIAKPIYVNGFPKISINGKCFDAAMFRSFRPSETNVKQFTDIGINLFQLLATGMASAWDVKYSNFGEIWVGEDNYDFSPLDQQIELFHKVNPKSFLNVMLQLDSRDWWVKSHSKEVTSFYYLSSEMFSETFIKDAKNYLKAVIKHCEEKYGDIIFAYSYSCGKYTEWFTDDLFNKDKRKLELFRNYINNQEIEIPDLRVVNTDLNCFRDENDLEKKYLDFCANQSANLVNEFAKVIKEETNGNKLVGIFYGYVTIYPPVEQNINYTNAYEKVWNNPNVDMIYCPTDYARRTYDGPSSYQLCVDSLRLNNKLYIHELDLRGHKARRLIDNKLMFENQSSCMDETIQLSRREIGNILLKKCGFWWFDMFSNFYDDKGYDVEFKKELEIYKQLSKINNQNLTETLLIVDPMSFHYVREFGEGSVNLCEHCKLNLHKAGINFDFINQNDLFKLDVSKYKLFIFASTNNMTNELRTFISDKLKDKYKFFIYSSGLYKNGNKSISNIEELTNIKLVQKNNDKEIKASFRDEEFYFFEFVNKEKQVNKLMDIFIVDDIDAKPIAYYSSNDVAVAQKDRVFYSGISPIPSSLFREIAELSGVHLYTDLNNVIEVGDQIITAYTSFDNLKIYLKEDGEYLDIFEDIKVVSNNKVLEIKNAKYKSKILLKIK